MDDEEKVATSGGEEDSKVRSHICDADYGSSLSL